MIRNRRQWLANTMAVALVLFATACTREHRSILFRYANEQPEAAVRSQSMLRFKEQLEARSGGRIRVELYFGGVLGTERELMDFLALGVLQGTRGGYFADANPQFKLFTLPFLVDDWDQAMHLMTSEFTAGINWNARERGFHIPATGISQGFRAHTNSRHPIRHPDDLKGMKMRVPSQEVYVQTARAFGANPQELPSIEIYQALQTGVVDGQDNPPANIWDYKIHEVSDYLTITHYSTGPDPFMVNLEWYENLPADLQQVFDAVARETMAWSDQRSREKEQEYVAKLEQTLEVNYVRGAELLPFQEAVRPVYQHFVDQGDFDWDDIETARRVAREHTEGDPGK